MDNKKLTRNEVLAIIDSKLMFPRAEKGTIIKTVDYTGNPLAPEKYGYKYSFICDITKERKKGTLWVNTYGMIGE